MQKWIHSLVVFLAALLLAYSVPAPQDRNAQPAVEDFQLLRNDPCEANHSRFLQPEIPGLHALPVETGNTELRHTSFRFQEPREQAFSLSIKALATRQKQYLCRTIALRPNLPSWQIAFPFLEFW